MKAKSPWVRMNTKDRAGTTLNFAGGNVIKIWGPGFKGEGEKVHGHFDQRQRVYQSGGELSNFVYWKDRLFSFDGKVWATLLSYGERIEWLEFIDHELNHCYRMRMPEAMRIGRFYSAGIGQRWGVPMDAWAKSGGPEPERPLPPDGPTQVALL